MRDDNGIMSADIIPVPNAVSAHKRRKAVHTMEACGHGIMSADIIPVPNAVSAHKRRKAAHTMGACGHGIMINSKYDRKNQERKV